MQAVLGGYIDSTVNDYNDLQYAAVDHISEPSGMDALRMFSKGHPALIRGGFSPVLSDRDWSDPATYTDIHDGEVTIAVTDDGLADSVRVVRGETTFVKPLEEKMPMSTFFSRLSQNEEEIVYLQSQDGNIFRSEEGTRASELSAFGNVIARDVAWMKEATGQTAEAVNLWIGSSRSTTSFHHDPYENIYHVLSGSKTFTLISPINGVWFDQPFHAPSTLVRTPSGLEPRLDDDSRQVPWVSSLRPPPRSCPIVVQVNEGETLYLPSGWWHKVEQKEGSGGLAVAVNYWYASEMRAERYAYERLMQRVALGAGLGVLPVDDDVDEGVWGSDVSSGEEWDPSEWGR